MLKHLSHKCGSHCPHGTGSTPHRVEPWTIMRRVATTELHGARNCDAMGWCVSQAGLGGALHGGWGSAGGSVEGLSLLLALCRVVLSGFSSVYFVSWHFAHFPNLCLGLEASGHRWYKTNVHPGLQGPGSWPARSWSPPLLAWAPSQRGTAWMHCRCHRRRTEGRKKRWALQPRGLRELPSWGSGLP